MKINKIRLNNIRSYKDQEIKFPDGSVLLAGDIGSGKSSILHAIDFALFGIRRDFSGEALLRNGEKNGSVELDFSVDNKNYIIKRNLKRTNSVAQDTGYLLIDNVKQEKGAVELKQAVLDILNYPQEMLTKKSLIFRYTVYTPQEEMKAILLGDKIFRTDALRKVFGIDKYKIIKSNAEIFISKLKEKRKEYAGRIYDLEEKKQERDDVNKKMLKIKENVLLLSSELESAKIKVKAKKEELKETEIKIERLNELIKSKEINEIKIKSNLDNINKYDMQIHELRLEIEIIEEEIKNTKFQLEPDKIKVLNEQIIEKESIRRELESKINENKISINNSEDIINDVKKLDICPLCRQKVSEEHLEILINKEAENIVKNKEVMRENDDKLKIIIENLNSQRKEVELLKNEMHKQELIRVKEKNLKEKLVRKENISKEASKLKLENLELNEQNSKLKFEIEKDKEIEFNYRQKREELEKDMEEEKKISIDKAKSESDLENNAMVVRILEEDIAKKERIRQKINNLEELQNWLKEHFVNVVEIIEKKIMLKLHADFNYLFQKWFNMLIDAEVMTVRLDEEYSPVIEQNGHEISYEYLSGGEKTGVALAYRLALNKVINDVTGNIKTKDLLILDEPTDGFSYEQLDKMKLVIEELDTKQIILVSHESKIESFVNNIIRLNKTDHVTEVSYN